MRVAGQKRIHIGLQPYKFYSNSKAVFEAIGSHEEGHALQLQRACFGEVIKLCCPMGRDMWQW